jgi:hypothetical protein
MCAATLALEAVVIALSVPVMITVSDVERGPAFAAGLGLAALALLTAGLLRYPWAYALGWVVQAGVLALGLVTAAMFVIGVLFGALWVMALVLGRRVELIKAQREVGP